MAKMDVNFTSYTLQRDVEISVVIPSMTILEVFDVRDKGGEYTHRREHKYPVLYLLHGFANNRNSWLNYTSVIRYAEERRIALVTLSAENSSYAKIGGNDFKKFVHHELPEFVSSMFPISERPEDTYIAGLSMGGSGTAVCALTNPERFCAMGVFSPNLQVMAERILQRPLKEGEDIEYLRDEYDPFRLAEKVAKEGKKFPKVYLACGCKDKNHAIDEKYRDFLRGLGADVTWDEDPRYAHEWPFWDEQIRKFLDFIPRTDYYATLPRTGV